MDFQGLLTVLKNTEDNPNVYMSKWDCGTSQCMIGSFCVANKEDKLRLLKISEIGFGNQPFPQYNTLKYEEAIAARFGITEREAMWLFTMNPLDNPLDNPVRCSSAIILTKEQALQRLRKFIYYKMHKQEMITEVGKNKQQINLGRNMSGRNSAVLASNA